MTGATLDAGALIAFERARRPVVALVARAAPEMLTTFTPAIKNGLILSLIIRTPQGEMMLGPDQKRGKMAAGIRECPE